MMEMSRSSPSLDYKNRQNSFTYDVKREVYNEENFHEEHRRRGLSSGNVDINITTFRHHIQCRCSWHRFLKCLLTIFPFLEWMCLYRFKDWLLGDLLAGLSVGLVQIPQGLTLSLMTRQLIPPLNIAYAAFSSSIIYVIFGSCHQMAIGPFFLVSALLINVLKVKPFNHGHLVLGTFVKDDFSVPSYFSSYNISLNTVAATTFLTGVIQLSMGVLGLGFVATYLPEAAINAYLAAAALHIVLSQLACIFGIIISFHSGPISFFYNIINYCLGLPKANSTSILLFLTSMVTLRINRCVRLSFNHYPIQFPVELFLILGFTAFSNKISLATESSSTLIDIIPFSFLFPVVPDFSILSQVILPAISLALVSSFLLIFLGKKISSSHHYKVNSNQDLITIGICNVVNSIFRSCVFTGAVARTIIQDKSGGRQQFASLVGAGLMLLLMVKAGAMFYELPNAVLAGIIVSNVLPCLDTVFSLPLLWRQDQYDCIIWMMTFMAVIFLGLDAGLLISLFSAFFIITVRSHRTKILLLGQIPNTNIYRSTDDYREVVSIPGVKIFQCCNSITFVNVYHLKHKLLKELHMVRVPLKEEEMFALFNESYTSLLEDRMCRCSCNCEELEPPPRIAFTERFENNLDSDSSSVNLIRCSHFEDSQGNDSSSEEQVPPTAPSRLQRNPEPDVEDVEGAWPAPSPPGRSQSVPTESQSMVAVPYTDRPLRPIVHTVILDLSMVHFVDTQALVILRQICYAFHNANLLVLFAGCHPSVVRLFEKNDFFDKGVTKAQLFLSLHDAVLFALSQGLLESSELSDDQSETVIQETYSETNKSYKPSSKVSSSFAEGPSMASPGRAKVLEPVEEELGFDLQLAPERAPGLGLNLALPPEPEAESELEADSELEPETEPDTQADTEPETDLELEPQRDPRQRAHTIPPRHYWPPHRPARPTSLPQMRPKARWGGEEARDPPF